MGRTILYLKAHESAPYQDIILHACLHNQTYDPQIEGFKTRYILEVIALTSSPAFYKQHILNATAKIDDETDDRDANHLMELTREFALAGDVYARQIIYDIFDKNFEDEGSLGAGAIIEIDELDGFVYIAEKIADVQRQKKDPSVYDFLLSELEEQIGEQVAQEALIIARKNNKNLDFYLELVEKDRKSHAKYLKRRNFVEAFRGYNEMKPEIQKYNFGYLRRWGQQATEKDLREAAYDLLHEKTPEIILRYLFIFGKVSFPLNPEPLFEYMTLEYPEPYFSIAHALLRMLKQVKHTSVRNFALQLIAEKQFIGLAVGLLTSNFKTGDWALLEDLSKQNLEDDNYHNFGWSIQDIFEQHPEPTAAQTLLNIYEYGLCSFCRRKIILLLKSIDALTPQIQAECLYDSNEHIRALARNGFTDTL